MNAPVAAPQTKAIAKQPDRLASFRDYLEVRKPQLAKILPKHMTPDRVTRVTLTAITRDPKLLSCTPESVYLALMQASELGLEPGGALGHAYLIAYGNVCQFQTGYKGLIELARRSGEVEDIQANVVYKNDRCRIREGVGATVEHEIALTNRGEILGAYAVAILKNGQVHPEYMTEAEILDVRDKFAKSKAAWEKSPTEFYRKTVVRRLLKYIPLSPEKAGDLERALEAEDAGPVIDVTAEPVPAQTKSKTRTKQVLEQARAAEETVDVKASPPESEPECEPNTGEVVPAASVTSPSGKVHIEDQA